MAASLTAMLVGADMTATRVAASSKGVDAGKLFAMSFSAQIASAASMEISGAPEKIETGERAQTNGIAEKMNAEGDVGFANALAVPMPPGTAGQSVVVPKDANRVVLPDAKAVVTISALPKAEALKTGVTTDSQEVAPAVKSEQSTEAAPPEEILGQANLPQPGAMEAIEVPAKTAADASGQAESLQSEQKVSFGKLSAQESSSDDAVPVKRSAKKPEGSKDALSVKGVDVAKSSAGAATSPHGLISAPASGQVVMTAASCAAASQKVSDCKTQVVSEPAIKSVAVPAAVVAKQGVQGATSGGDQGTARQAVAAGKVAIEGAAPKPSSDNDVSSLQKSDPAVKSPASVVSTSAKPQSGVVHSSDGVSMSAPPTVLNATAVGSAIRMGAVGLQKNAVADVSASAVMGHAGSGESSGVPMQTVDGGHRTLVATPTVLEVGIPNGTQGWLKVRAELAGGGVNATVSAASSAGQEMLHRELPALSAYLQQEKVAVNSVVVHAPAGGSFRGLSGGSGNGAGGQAQGQGRGGRQAGQSFFEGAHASESDEVLASVQRLRSGGWLSVRA